MSISERLKLYLFYSKKNVTQLAEELGVTQSAFNRVVKGDGLPSSKVLTPLAEIGLNINWLLIGEGDMMRDGKNLTNDNNTIITNSEITNSNNRNTTIGTSNNKATEKEQSKIHVLKLEVQTLESEIKSLKKEVKAMKVTNQVLQDAKAVLENQIKDKEMIISLLQGK